MRFVQSTQWCFWQNGTYGSWNEQLVFCWRCIYARMWRRHDLVNAWSVSDGLAARCTCWNLWAFVSSFNWTTMNGIALVCKLKRKCPIQSFVCSREVFVSTYCTWNSRTKWCVSCIGFHMFPLCPIHTCQALHPEIPQAIQARLIRALLTCHSSNGGTGE